MKVCKIEITKKLTGNRCDNIYPQGYDPNEINVVAYDEKTLVKGNNIGYCIGLVADDFLFTNKMIEIDKIESDGFIDQGSDAIIDTDAKSKFLNARKKMLTDAGII